MSSLLKLSQGGEEGMDWAGNHNRAGNANGLAICEASEEEG